MAETIKIPIEFYPREQKKIIVAQEIRIRKGTKVIWELIHKDFPFMRFRNITFQIYFEDSSPFKWQTESFHFSEFSLIIEDKFEIASGIANEPGDYKYGIKVLDTNKKEPIYDEDPYLIVY